MANKLNNVLNNAEIATITILQFIKIELLEEKARLQREGSALEEPVIDDEPQEDDFVQTPEMIEGTITFDQLLEAQLNAPTPIEEQIKEAEKLIPASPKNSPEDMLYLPGKKPAVWWARFKAFLVARSAWKVRKQELEHEYERTKTDVVNRCYGIDFAIKRIDHEIERQRTGEAITVGDRVLCQEQ